MLDISSFEFFKQLTKLSYIQEIWLFGSRARGDNQDRSDIDLAVLCPEATISEWLYIKDIVEQARTLLSVDCIRLDGLRDDSELKKSIIREGIQLYERSKS